MGEGGKGMSGLSHLIEQLAHCHLCPRSCGVNRLQGQRGRCGAGRAVYAARAALHRWEEPPLSGTNGSGAVFFSHCPLGCVFCQNRAISRRTDGQGQAVSVAALADTFLSLQQQGAHNINLVTAVHYVPQVLDALSQAKAAGLTIPIVYNSSGYESLDTLRLLEGWVDIYLPDFKYYSSYYAARYSDAPDYRETAVEAIREMVRQTSAPVYDAAGLLQRGTIVRHLMLPGLAGDTAQVLRTLATEFGDRILVSLMRQYTPFAMEDYPELGRVLTTEEYADACALFQSFGLAGFFQQGDAIGESFIPAFDGTGLSPEPPAGTGLSPNPPSTTSAENADSDSGSA